MKISQTTQAKYKPNSRQIVKTQDSSTLQNPFILRKNTNYNIKHLEQILEIDLN